MKDFYNLLKYVLLKDVEFYLTIILFAFILGVIYGIYSKSF